MQPVEAEHRRQTPLAHRRRGPAAAPARSSARTPATRRRPRAVPARSAAARTIRRAAAPAAPRKRGADGVDQLRDVRGRRVVHQPHPVPPGRRCVVAAATAPYPTACVPSACGQNLVGLAVHLLLPGVVTRPPKPAPTSGCPPRRHRLQPVQPPPGRPTPRARRARRCRRWCRRPGRAPRPRGAARRAGPTPAAAPRRPWTSRLATSATGLDRRGRTRDNTFPTCRPNPDTVRMTPNLTSRRDRRRFPSARRSGRRLGTPAYRHRGPTAIQTG